MFHSGDRPSSPAIEHPSALQFSPAIQPQGLLLGVMAETLTIHALSPNLTTYFKAVPEKLLGKPLHQLLGKPATQTLCQHLQEGRSPFPLSLTLPHQVHPWTVWVQKIEDQILLELEPPSNPPPQSSLPLGIMAQLAQVLGPVQTSRTLADCLSTITAQLQPLIGYARVLIYQLTPEDDGLVVTETLTGPGTSLNGLHFRVATFPLSARNRYQKISAGLGFRYIQDLIATPVPLLLDPAEAEQSLPLDLALLRPLEPDCREFLQALQVRSFLALPIICSQTLWGFICAHHPEPRPLPVETRAIAQLLSPILSREIETRLRQEEQRQRDRLQTIHSQLIQAFDQSEQFTQALIQPNSKILDLVNATGAAICSDRGITLIGETPEAEEVFPLLTWASEQLRIQGLSSSRAVSNPPPSKYQGNPKPPHPRNSVFATHTLPHQYLPARAYRHKAAGILLLELSREQRSAILWFRPEVPQTITWASPPPTQKQPFPPLSPWTEPLPQTALPWLPAELAIARDLRTAMTHIALHQVEELLRTNRELQQSHDELESFVYVASHDLKEPLRGIYHYTTFLLEDYSTILDPQGIQRMESLVHLTHRMDQLIEALLKFSKMREIELHLSNVNLNKLLPTIAEMLQLSRPETPFNLRIPRPLPIIQADIVLVNEVFANLLSNAIKYNDSPDKWVEVGYLTAEEAAGAHSQLPKLQFYVRDNGIGIRPQHQEMIFQLFKRLHGKNKYGGGTGAGLTLVKKIVERHQGQIWLESTPKQGTTFWFTLT